MAISSFLRTATRVVMGFGETRREQRGERKRRRETDNYTFPTEVAPKCLGAGSIAQGGSRSGRHAEIAHDQNSSTDAAIRGPSVSAWSRKRHDASSSGSGLSGSG